MRLNPRFDITIKRDGNIYKDSYEKGEPKVELVDGLLPSHSLLPSVFLRRSFFLVGSYDQPFPKGVNRDKDSCTDADARESRLLYKLVSFRERDTHLHGHFLYAHGCFFHSLLYLRFCKNEQKKHRKPNLTLISGA